MQLLVAIIYIITSYKTIMSKILVPLAYVTGNVLQVGVTDRFSVSIREPKSIKNQTTGMWEIKHYIRYKIFIHKNKLPQALLDLAEFETRKNKNITITVACSGTLDRIYTRDNNPKVTEPQIVISVNSSEDFLTLYQEMSKAEKKNDDDNFLALPDEYNF